MKFSQKELKVIYWRSRERAISFLKNDLPRIQQTLSPSRVKLRLMLFTSALKKPIVQLHGVKLRLGIHLSLEVLEYIHSGEYERPEIKMIEATIENDDIVMELGSGLGLVSTFCAKKIGSERVFTFEANPALSSLIKETYDLNEVSPNFENCLVADHNGTQTFYISKAFWGSSIIPSPSAAPIQIATRSFNDELKRIKPTFLIVDIEGGEWELSHYMQLEGVRKIVIETHPWKIGEDKNLLVEKAFENAGFKKISDLSTDHHFFYQRHA